MTQDNNTIPQHFTHYYTKQYGPFTNVMELYDNNNAEVFRPSAESTIVHKRFSHSFYFPCRKKAEERLRVGFAAKGGVMKDKYPIYFCYGDSDYIEACSDSKFLNKIQIPVRTLNSKYMSFTYPDSMALHVIKDVLKDDRYLHSYYYDVFTYSEINTVIQQYGFPLKRWNIDNEHKFDTFIEMQYWDRRGLMEMLNEMQM